MIDNFNYQTRVINKLKNDDKPTNITRWYNN